MQVLVWDAKSQFEKYKDQQIFDCMIAEFLLSNGRPVVSLEKTLEKYKATTLEELAHQQSTKLQSLPKIQNLLENIEIPLIKVLWQMEQNGIILDADSLRNVGEKVDKEILIVNEKIQKETGNDLNLNSSQQVGNFLVDTFGVPLKKTKTGKYATNEPELREHKDSFPIILDLLKYRELTKLRSTYIESLIDKRDTSGKVHTTYQQVAVNTGRLSSTNPNLQNIPVTSVLGQEIKSCFIASPGTTLISFDYSQQELRILAHLTNEDELIKAFTAGNDVHKITASKIFNVKYEDVTKEQRSIGKTINFGIIYGMSSFGLSMSLQIPVPNAQKFIDAFYVTYPKIKVFYDNFFAEGKKNDFVETLLGRRRYVYEYPGQKFIDNNTRRVLLNYPIQGSAADIIKLAMVKIQKEILDKNNDIKLLLQIHDDLVFEVEDNNITIKEYCKQIRDIMCNAYPLSVPIEVDVKIGKKWGEMKSI